MPRRRVSKRRVTRRSLARAIPIGLALAIDVGACGDPSHLFLGRAWIEHRDCLGTTSSIDVVEGESASTSCPARCLADPHGDGGRTIYVSTMCEPFPFEFDASGSDPACPTALSAFERNDTCLVDGGSTHPPPVDSATD